MNKLSLAAIAMFASTGIASAEGFYAGGGASLIQAEESGIDISVVNLTGIAGYEINDTIALEGEFSFTLAEDEVDVGGFDVNVGLGYVGGFVKASFPLSPEFSAHGRLGYVNAESKTTVDGTSFTNDDSSVAFGLGGEYDINPAAAIRGDATFAEFDGTEAAVFTLGTVFSF